MTLTLTPLPSHVGAYTVLPNTDPSTGVLTFTARPTRHAWGVSQDLLAALGARDDVFGAGRRHDQDLALLHAWLHAYNIQVIVVRHANNLLNRDISRTLMDNLFHVATAVGAHLALTCDETVTSWLNDWVEQRGGSVHTEDAPLLALLQATTRPVTATSQPEVADFPQYLPRVDFYGFRARCRAVLTPNQFARLDTLYVDAFQEVRAAPYASAQEAHDRLAARIAKHTSPGEVLTVARAAQAAMFTHGLLLKVDTSSLLRGIQESEHRRLTPSEVRALRAYRTPWRSSANILRDADLTLNDIKAMTLANVNEAGTLDGVTHLPLHDDARTYLRAQRRYRLDEGATPSDPFITQTARSVSQAFRRCGAELNLPSSANHEKATESRSDRWRKHLGVALLPLVTQHLPQPDPAKRAA